MLGCLRRSDSLDSTDERRYNDAASPVLHGWEGVLQLASHPLFPPNIMMVIIAKQFYFYFIRPEDISSKGMIFVPPCAGYIDIGLVFTVDIDTFCTGFLQLLHKVL
jgi:hypothetical protein